MTKNDIINDVVSSLVFTFTKDQLELVKSTFIVKMQGYEVHELCTLPSTEVCNNEWIMKRFAIDMLAKGLKQSTIKSYILHATAFFDHTNLNYRAVTAQDIIDYMAIKKVTPNKFGKMNSDSHIANICKVLFVFFQWAYKKHHIDEDIMRDVDRIKQPQKKKERLTLEEISACRHAISLIDKVPANATPSHRLRMQKMKLRKEALFELMLSTGMRVSEIANLKIEDINFEKRRIHISEGKTEHAVRDVFLNFPARDAIIRLIGDRKSGFVFRPAKNYLADNEPIGNSALEKWAKEIGEAGNCHCKTTCHVFRKTFCSEVYRKTKNVKLVSKLLGHANTAVTEKYYLVDDLQDIEYQALQAA
jgi:integrase/recombinase XerD